MGFENGGRVSEPRSLGHCVRCSRYARIDAGSGRCRWCRRKRGVAAPVEIDDSIPWEEDAAAQEFVRAHPDGGTLEEIAAAFGVTRERVRQIEETALAKLRRRMTLLGVAREDVVRVLISMRGSTWE